MSVQNLQLLDGPQLWLNYCSTVVGTNGSWRVRGRKRNGARKHRKHAHGCLQPKSGPEKPSSGADASFLAGGTMLHEVPQGWQVAWRHLQILVVVALCPERSVWPFAEAMQLLPVCDVYHLILSPLLHRPIHVQYFAIPLERSLVSRI